MACEYWECAKTDPDGECSEIGGECLGDMCEDCQECRSYNKQDGEDCPRY